MIIIILWKILKKSYTAEAGLNLDQSITEKNKLKYKVKILKLISISCF